MSASNPDEACVWVLNLDAEHELAGGARYQPTERLLALVQRERRQLFGGLVRPGDRIVHGAGTELEVLRLASDGRSLRPEPPSSCRGRVGRAWSPTPRALATLEGVGARLATPVARDVLARVNARPFAAAVRAELASESFDKTSADTLDAALALLARPSPAGWLVRRLFGAAGRGRRRLASGRPDAGEHAWLVASLRQGPLVIEPWVTVLREMSRCGRVRDDGHVTVAAPLLQLTNEHGAWTRSFDPAPAEIDGREDAALGAAVESAGRALARAGYVGPFGIDAFVHRGADGRSEVLNPLSEINARYTMDWTEPSGEVARSFLA